MIENNINDSLPPWILDKRLSEKAKDFMTWITHCPASKELIIEIKRTINDSAWDELINFGYINQSFKDLKKIEI